MVEGFLTAAWTTIGVDIVTPFPRMTYDEAIRLYGIDKPDMRLPAMTDVQSAFAPEQPRDAQCRSELPVVAIVTPSVGELSRKERDDLKLLFGDRRDAKVFEDIKRLEKTFPDADRQDARNCETGRRRPARDRRRQQARRSRQRCRSRATKPRPSTPPPDNSVSRSAQKFAAQHGAFDKRDYRFLWVTDFPMFEWDETEKRWNAAHHPFTSPHEEDMGILESDPGRGALARLRRGAQRHRAGLGLDPYPPAGHPEQNLRGARHVARRAEARFGFFLEALQYGTPPHGGIALGLDRIVMILAGAASLREVIPFPKTAKAIDLMMDAPTPVSDKQLKELGIAVVPQKDA